MLDHQPGRLEPPAEQRADAEARRHLGEIRQRRAVGQRQAHVLNPQIELVGVVVDADADSGHRYPDAGAGTLERLLDIGGEPVELDRALQQPPDDDADNEDQDRGDAAQPVEQPVRMMDDVLRRRCGARGGRGCADVGPA